MIPNGNLAGLAANDADGVGERGIVPAVAACLDFHAPGLFQVAAFPGRQEEVGFDGVLLGVEIVVTAAECVEGFVGAALDDPPRLDNENLIGTSNCREPVRD